MKKLYRSAKNSYIFGIFGGLGEYFEKDATLLRLVFIFFVLVTGFFPGIIAYIIAFFIVPENPKDIAKQAETVAKEHAEEAKEEDKKDSNEDTKEDKKSEIELL